MSLVRKIYSKGVLTVLDFGADSVVVLVADRKENGSFHIVGAGDATAHGIQDGEVTHPGDATESIVEALKKAENSSGIKIEKLYYNFDDALIQNTISRGTKYLNGEGEIQASDIEEARKIAERLVENFDRSIIYSKEVQYVIDDKDRVVNPIGVFGKKIEVFAHILQARSSHCEAWQKLMTRSQISKCTAVPSAWSTAYGLLSEEERINKKLILDLGKDYFTAFIFFNNRICDLKVILKSQVAHMSDVSSGSFGWAGTLIESNSDIQQVLITGDLAQEASWVQSVKDWAQFPALVSAPQAIDKLHYPKYASVAGLLSVADEIESRMPLLRAEKNIFSNVRERALAFINDYF